MSETTITGVIIALVDDMFFASKIRGAAEHSGRRLKFIKSVAELEEVSRGLPAQDPTVMIIIDLNSQRFDPIAAIKKLKSHPTLGDVPILGFLSHVQVDLKDEAETAGCDRVMPRSAFSLKLPEIMAQV